MRLPQASRATEIGEMQECTECYLSPKHGRLEA